MSKRGLRRGLFIGGGVVAAGALVLVGANLASALNADGKYRVATAERGSVAETVATNGTIASASRYDLAFQTAGTVATVKVSLGETVTAGQTLATLDRTELEDAVSEAEQAVTDAEQTLAEDQEAQASGTSSSSSSSSGLSASSLISGQTSTSGQAAASPTTSGGSTSGSESGAGSSGSAGGADGSGGSGGSGSGEVDPAVTAAIEQVTAAQQAMLERYQQVQLTLDETNAIVSGASQVCAPFLSAVLVADDASGDGGTDGNGDGSTDGSGAEGADGATDAGTDGSGADTGTNEVTAETGTAAGMTLAEAQAALTACQTEITRVQEGQASVSAGQQEVQDLAAALNTAVTALQTAVQESASGSGTSGSGSSGSGSSGSGSGAASGSDSAAASGATGSAGSGSAASGSTGSSGSADVSGSASSGATGAAGGSGTSGTITAERLLADQAQIDLAEAELLIAQAQLEFADLTSPIDGTIGAVSISAGDEVTAGSSTAVITVIGEDGYVAEATVSLTEVSRLAVGQDVEATVAASGASYPGTVSSIGILNVSTTSTPAFTVVVALDTGDDELLNGGSAQLSISTASVEDAVTVPTSAVHRDGSVATVDLLVGGEVQSTEVELGAIGNELTEIVSGVEEGDTVVLAEIDAEIASDETTSESTGLSGLSGSSDSGFSGNMGGMGGGTGGPPSMPGGF